MKWEANLGTFCSEKILNKTCQVQIIFVPNTYQIKRACYYFFLPIFVWMCWHRTNFKTAGYLEKKFGGCRNWTQDHLITSQHILKDFLQYLALDVTANCICEILCLALDGFDLCNVHKLSSKEKKSLGFEPRAAGWEERMLHLCYGVPLILKYTKGKLTWHENENPNDDL